MPEIYNPYTRQQEMVNNFNYISMHWGDILGQNQVSLKTMDGRQTTVHVGREYLRNISGDREIHIQTIDELARPYNLLADPLKDYGDTTRRVVDKKENRFRHFADIFTIQARERKILDFFEYVRNILGFSLSNQEHHSLEEDVIVAKTLGTPNNFFMQFVREVSEGKRLVPLFRVNLVNSSDSVKYVADYRLNVNLERKIITLVPLRWEIEDSSIFDSNEIHSKYNIILD